MSFDPHQSIGRRGLLESAMTTGATAAGAGTYSIFTDRETSRSHVAAGTLGLQAAAGANRTNRIETVDNGDAGVETLLLENVGSVSGNLGLTLSLATCEDKNNAEDRPCEWEPDTDNAEGQKSQNDQNSRTNSNSGTNGNNGTNGNRLGEAVSIEVGFKPDDLGGGDDATVAVREKPAAVLPFGERQSTNHIVTRDGSSTDTTQLYVVGLSMQRTNRLTIVGSRLMSLYTSNSPDA